MNSDITKNAAVRIAVVGLLVGAANFALVRPKLAEATEMKDEQSKRSLYLQQGEQVLVEEQDSLTERARDTAESRDKILLDLDASKGNQDQQQFLRLASARGLTITRVEPIRSSVTKQGLGEGLTQAEALLKEYRIECRGAFSGFVSLLSDIQSSDRRLSVTDFRMVPAGENEARVSMTISLLELTEYPSILKTMLVEELEKPGMSQSQGEGS